MASILEATRSRPGTRPAASKFREIRLVGTPSRRYRHAGPEGLGIVGSEPERARRPGPDAPRIGSG